MKDFTISGYVTKNVETRSTNSGQTVTRFSVNSPNYNRQSGQSAPQFFECEYWHSGDRDDKAANIAEGALLLLWGQLSFESWQDQTGQNRSKTRLKVREIGVVRPPQPNRHQGRQRPAPQQATPSYAPSQAAPAPQQAAPAPAPQQYQPTMGLYDEDIPF
ncbi:MAG TPA: single-stranded DNA-binding protein [Candidatus Aphodovivens avistercoris]|nr:single-stranded DNA-binding protein [Candidatus Aphodovivens avistercoris]